MQTVRLDGEDLERLAAGRTQLPILCGRRTDLYEIGER